MTLPNVLCCFKNCFYGTGFTVKTTGIREKIPIILDSSYMGHDVVLLKDSTRICGTGGALCSAPLVQSKSYFEVKIQQTGKWSVGIGTRKAQLNKAIGGTDSDSWVYCSDGTMRHNNSLVYSDLVSPAEGDIIGVAFDHVELNFFLNGKPLEKPLTGVRGHVFPALYVDDGAVLDLIVDNFHYTHPNGFERILIEQSLL